MMVRETMKWRSAPCLTSTTVFADGGIVQGSVGL